MQALITDLLELLGFLLLVTAASWWVGQRVGTPAAFLVAGIGCFGVSGAVLVLGRAGRHR